MSEESRDLRFESIRMETFHDRPLSIDIRAATKSGLYLKEGYILQCFSCGISFPIGPSEPSEDHRARSPECLFLTKEPVGNVPILEGIGQGRGLPRPKHPAYSADEERLRTFDLWPIGISQRPIDLSNAGFFYTGVGDRVICFQCSIGLHHWEPEDIPWVEHALQSKECPLLIDIMGHEFIENVYNPPPPIDEGISMVGVCKICYERPANISFVPCGHVATCLKCSSRVNTCPICRYPFERILKLFYP